ncbi:MAG: hypothetical protein JWM43_1774 [Acidobacteriaceae bacterium]|nr:hypothetical protein [Acidobacteriaceae bacterium]
METAINHCQSENYFKGELMYYFVLKTVVEIS